MNLVGARLFAGADGQAAYFFWVWVVERWPQDVARPEWLWAAMARTFSGAVGFQRCRSWAGFSTLRMMDAP